MKLQGKILFHISLAVLFLNLMLFITTRVILQDSFETLDRDAARQSLEKIQNTLDNEEIALSRIALDWAHWDDAYRFVQGEPSSFIQTNLPDSVFSDLNLNLIAFANASGRLVYSRVADFSVSKSQGMDWQVILNLAGRMKTTDPQSVAQGLRGAVSVSGQPMLLVAYPILPSNEKAPPRGILFLGRALNRQRIDGLAGRSQLHLQLLPAGDLRQSADEVLSQKLAAADNLLVIPKDSQENIGYLLLKDFFGRPSFYIHTEIPRKIYEGGTGAIGYFLRWNFLVTLLFGIFSYAILHKLTMTRKKRHEVEAQCHTLVENISLGVSLIDRDFNILMANSALGAFFKRSVSSFAGHKCFREFKRQSKICSDCPGVRAMKSGRPASEEISGRHADGSPWLARMHAFPVFDPEGKANRFIEIVEDISSQKETENALRRSDQLAKTVLNSMRDAVAIIDIGSYTFASVNRVFLEGFNMREDDVVGHSCYELLPQKPLPFEPNDQFCPIEETEKTGKHAQADYSLPDAEGEIRHIEVFTSPIKDDQGKVVQVVWVARDVSERKKAEQEIRHLAYHDALTGLPNRSRLEERLEQILAQGQPGTQRLAMLFLDLDRFKNVNDTLGHAMGDLLLKSVARRLRTSIREGDMVARLGGDEFVILLVRAKNRQEVEVVARKILDIISAPFFLDGQKIFITTSIGIAMYPLDGEGGDILKKSADMAMYAAKEKGRNAYHFYSEQTEQQALARHGLELDLQRGLDRGEFFLVYQPQFDLRSGELTGVEALLRWRHPERGEISPLQFLRIAEETHMIRPLGEWVLETACAQNKAWQTAGYPPLRVSVNLSRHHFRDSDFGSVVDRVLDKTGLDPRYLELELAESVLMENTDSLAKTLDRLKMKGIHLTVDTFDTGYAPLRYLKYFPIDKVKLSYCVTESVMIGQEMKEHLDDLIEKARRLNLEIIAGGVETMEQLDHLRAMKCFKMQGYYLERPLSPEEMPRRFLGGLFQSRTEKRTAKKQQRIVG